MLETLPDGLLLKQSSPLLGRTYKTPLDVDAQRRCAPALNRQVIRRLCPPLAIILINNYRAPTELFVDGDTLLSQEGTTQGDPLAMPLGNYKQIWYAAAVGKITELREWWDKLTTAGASKTWLITKKDCIFTGTGVNVTTDGKPYLGVP